MFGGIVTVCELAKQPIRPSRPPTGLFDDSRQEKAFDVWNVKVTGPPVLGSVVVDGVGAVAVGVARRTAPMNG